MMRHFFLQRSVSIRCPDNIVTVCFINIVLITEFFSFLIIWYVWDISQLFIYKHIFLRGLAFWSTWEDVLLDSECSFWSIMNLNFPKSKQLPASRGLCCLRRIPNSCQHKCLFPLSCNQWIKVLTWISCIQIVHFVLQQSNHNPVLQDK